MIITIKTYYLKVNKIFYYLCQIIYIYIYRNNSILNDLKIENLF